MRALLILAVILATGCSYTEREVETGHKGKARIDPYLAGARLLEEFGHEVVSRSGWPDFKEDPSMVMMPVSVLSAEAYVRVLRDWVAYGGHAVLLLENGESYFNDWAERSGSYGDKEALPDACAEWFEELGIEVLQETKKRSVDKAEFDDGEFEVFMEGWNRMRIAGGTGKRMLVSRELGEGLVTVVTDARAFRNRHIGDYDHAALLVALVDRSPYEGSVVFVRNASLSFWKLLWTRGWPAVSALLLLVAFWLWKNLPRFGPLDSLAQDTTLRAYDHHLEALGDFHWRLDKAEGLLKPLRTSLLERAHRWAFASGNRDGDLFQLIAERAGISRERAERAMTHERPSDPGVFTRVVADLQSIHLSIP